VDTNGRRGQERSPTGSSPGNAISLIWLGAIYWLNIYPCVRSELSRWETYARDIPDSTLREQALNKLTVERLNSEAAAFFAVLAPRSKRSCVIRLIVAFQLLYDYLDAVNELSGSTELRNGLQLHNALTDAVVPDRPTHDYYRHNPASQDGGYVHALVTTCRSIVRTLPSAANIEPVLAQATERCSQAQSHNHALVAEGERGLIDWCRGQVHGCDYLWWEIAAGGVSSLAIHALFALAAEPKRTIDDAAWLDAAYFPSICAISTLLDSLADHGSDASTTNHSFIARYHDSAHAAERLVTVVGDAVEQVGRLHNCRRHIVILYGIIAFYLSSASVDAGFAAPVADSLMRSIGPLARPMRAAMRLRRLVRIGRHE
jgi:tetraprenyl-beta-curcumene synthase